MQINQQRLLDRFLSYVACDSESGNEANFCFMMEQELKRLGLHVERDSVGEACGSNGWNVYARLEGEGEPLLFCSHMDTVSPGVGIQPVIRDGVIYSQGDTILAADDKSGIAAILEGLECIVEANAAHRPIEVLFTICEELGLKGSYHADYSKILSKEAIVLDSGSQDKITNQAPANVHLSFAIHGKSSHAGVAPQEGIHALKAAAQAIVNIPVGYVDEVSVMNVANLVSHGKTNIVPDLATFDMEIRSFDKAAYQAHIDASIAAVQAACDAYGATFTYELDPHTDVLLVPEDRPIVHKAQQALRTLGIEAHPNKTYGGSDTSWLFAHGIDAVNLGTGMDKAHGVNEHIAIADLERTASFVLKMMQN